jgi:hypothetical protein
MCTSRCGIGMTMPASRNLSRRISEPHHQRVRRGIPQHTLHLARGFRRQRERAAHDEVRKRAVESAADRPREAKREQDHHRLHQRRGNQHLGREPRLDGGE